MIGTHSGGKALPARLPNHQPARPPTHPAPSLQAAQPTQPTWVVPSHEVGHGAQPHMVRLAHQHILLWNGHLLHPLHQCVGPVEHDVAAGGK